MDCFTAQIIEWSKIHGRKDLPWTQQRSPFRVWVAEVMLQQTQVGAVLRHFDRFVERFPDVVSLSTATRDEVLSAWYGLGYYRRAIRMHEAAGIIVQKHAGQLPNTMSDLQALPGIGRSTAGSILASAWDISAPILDANVRRVLSRYHGVNGPNDTRITERQLWELAESHTPPQDSRVYNQAIMDFGALWCTQRNPKCAQCPVMAKCTAYQRNQVVEFPASPTSTPVHLTTLSACVVFDSSFACLLRLRGATGTYAHMWDSPELPTDTKVRIFLKQLQLPTSDFTLLERVHEYCYRISNQRVSEKLTIAKYNIPSIELGTPINTQWTSYSSLGSVGLPVRTMQRIELAKNVVESRCHA